MVDDRPDADMVAGRVRAVALLDELAAAGLLHYRLSSADLAGPEPHLDIMSDRRRIHWPAPRDVSPAAAALWEILRGRSGRLRL